MWGSAAAAAGLALLGTLLLAMLVVARGRPVRLWPRGAVALVPLRGLIADDAGFIRQLRQHKRDRSIKGFVIYIDSPGGAVAPSQSLYHELKKTREEGYPVVAAIGSVGASGAYYVALGADSVFALPGSLTGSVGALMELPNAERLLAKVGLSVEVVKSAEHKGAGSPFRRLGEADRRILQGVVDEVYRQFLDAVAQERGLGPDAISEIADGRVLTGRRAQELGLIDAEGNLSDAIAAAGRMAGLGPDPKVFVREEKRPRLWEWITGEASARALAAWLKGIEKDLVPWREGWRPGTPGLYYLMP